MITVLEGVRRRVPKETQVRVASGCDTSGTSTAGFPEALETARWADVALVVVGGRSGLVEGCTSGESIDRAELGLPGVQEALVEAVAGTGTPTVVVLVNGRPLALEKVARCAGALLETWLPGEEGGAALAEVLFGDVSPAGRLPVSLPRSVGQLPVHYNQKPAGMRSHWRGSYADLSTRPLF
jgi:beta-glucosidase